MQEDGSPAWASEIGEDEVEIFPGEEYGPYVLGLVHFDLDPKNGERVLGGLLMITIR